MTPISASMAALKIAFDFMCLKKKATKKIPKIVP